MLTYLGRLYNHSYGSSAMELGNVSHGPVDPFMTEEVEYAKP